MGQGERIESLTHCPLTPSSKWSLKLQGIKKSLNLHFRPNPILVAVSLTLILTAIGLVIWWMLIGVAVFEANLGGIMAGETPEILVLFYSACIMWFLVTLVTGLIAGWKLLSGVREFNKAKTSRRGEIR